MLAWAAGMVDTYGYLMLGHVFVSHITGNASVLAIALVQGNMAEAWHRGWAIPTFFVGSLIGGVLVENAEETSQVSRALLLEAALLVAFVVVSWLGAFSLQASGVDWAVLIALLGSAVGIQNAALTHRDTRGTHTTHLTGAMTDLAVELARVIRPREQAPAGRAAALCSRLAGFFVGGVIGAVLFQDLPAAGPLVPAAILIAFVAFAL